MDIYSCTQHSCPTAPTRFFRSIHELTLHNALHPPPPPIHSPSTTDQPSPTPTNTLDIGTSIFYADSENGSHNLWHLGIPFILQNTDHHPPDIQNTWRRHLKHRNHLNFLRLQAHTIQAITNIYTLSINSTPFWWLLFHLDMLVLAPSIATECSYTSIHATIRDHINSIYSGDIEYVYNMAMSCRQNSQNTTPTSTGHTQTAQRAADSDQFCTAVARATTSTSVTSIDNSNIHIVNKLYTQPVPTQNHPPPPPPSQPYALPGDICTRYGASLGCQKTRKRDILRVFLCPISQIFKEIIGKDT